SSVDAALRLDARDHLGERRARLVGALDDAHAEPGRERRALGAVRLDDARDHALARHLIVVVVELELQGRADLERVGPCHLRVQKQTVLGQVAGPKHQILAPLPADFDERIDTYSLCAALVAPGHASWYRNRQTAGISWTSAARSARPNTSSTR